MGVFGMEIQAYVKSPVASLCLACSSVKKRVRVTMSVLTFSFWIGSPFCAMVIYGLREMLKGRMEIAQFTT